MQESTQSKRYGLILQPNSTNWENIASKSGIPFRRFTSRAEINLTNDHGPDAILIDESFLDKEASDEPIITHVKKLWPSVLIFVTGFCDETFLAEALAMGADDFLTPSLSEDEVARRIIVRINAAALKSDRKTIRIGDMVIDTLQRSVTAPKGNKFLSPTEIRLVTELANAHGHVVSRDVLKHRCWPSADVSDNALNRKLYEVRRQLKQLSENINIRTIYGVGFVLEKQPQS